MAPPPSLALRVKHTSALKGLLREILKYVINDFYINQISKWHFRYIRLNTLLEMISLGWRYSTVAEHLSSRLQVWVPSPALSKNKQTNNKKNFQLQISGLQCYWVPPGLGLWPTLTAPSSSPGQRCEEQPAGDI